MIFDNPSAKPTGTAPDNREADLRQRLGANVRRLRRERGLTQEAVGLAAGLDQAYVSHIERGAVNPSVRVIGRLADALDVPPDRLLKAVGE